MMTRSLATPRLHLRAIRRDDVEELHRLFTDPDVRRYLLDDEVVGVDWVEAEVDRSDALFRRIGSGLFAIRRRGESQIIGFAGFRPFFEPPELQLLYGLMPAWWGRGLATEAAGAVIDHAFEELDFDRVVAAADAPNVPSIRVLERLGMTGVRKKKLDSGTTVWYSVEREEWRRHRDEHR